MIASHSVKIQSDCVCEFFNQSVICMGLCVVDFSISENGYGNYEIRLFILYFSGSDRAALCLSSRACEINKSGNAVDCLLMCAKYVLLVTAKNCDLVCGVGQVL